MSDPRSLLDRESRRFIQQDGAFERLVRRRDRKRRNQRIAAGVVGIAVFVAAIWIVTSVGPLDRSETSVVPGGDVTGPAETAPPPAPASAGPDVTIGHCSDGARSRLELTDTGDRIRVRFEVHRSPVGHEWRIVLRYMTSPLDATGRLFFRGIRVAGDSGVLAVQRSVSVREVNTDWFRAKAIDKETGQVCRA